MSISVPPTVLHSSSESRILLSVYKVLYIDWHSRISLEVQIFVESSKLPIESPFLCCTSSDAFSLCLLIVFAQTSRQTNSLIPQIGTSTPFTSVFLPWLPFVKLTTSEGKCYQS